MQITSATFSDPTMRPQLEQYYEKKKQDLIDAVNARPKGPDEVKFTAADGTTRTAKVIQVTGEQMASMMVSFDKWLEFQQDSFSNEGFGPKRLAMAQQRIAHLEEQSPDSSSNVRATFSVNGELKAYINADGTFATANTGPKHGDTISRTPMEDRISAIAEQADALGLAGQQRVDYLSREFNKAFSKEYKDLKTASYTSSTSPTKREFANAWYANFDVDQVYNDAMAEAQASLKEAQAWDQQRQANLNEMQNYLLSLQEAA